MTIFLASSLVLVALAVFVLVRERTRLRRSENRYRDLIDTLPHYIYSVDNADRYIAVNRAACEYFGRRESEIVGKTAVELGIPPEIARDWTDQNALIRSIGTTHMIDATRHLGEELHQLRSIISPIRGGDGVITGVTGICIDDTALKTAEAGRQRLRQAVEQMDEVMFMTGIDGRITYVNPAFKRVYGYSRDEVIGETPRILKSGELPAEYYATFWSELLAGRSVRIEYRNRAKDGTLVDVIGLASPVLDGDRITGFVAVHQDVTARNREAEERRQLDERMARVAKMEALGTLAGGIAHDFNNILSIILSHADLLDRISGRDSRAARIVGTIKQAVMRGAGLSRQILTFARRTEIDLAETDVAKLIEELAWMLIETLPRTIRITLDLEPELPAVMADSGQLHQALLNLCVNARDAMPAGGTLTIRARASVAELCIEISDTGIGMNAETRKRIFEPFFTTKEKGKGTGLGLALVYGVVSSHRGTIDVTSEPGAGTTFLIALPTATSVHVANRVECAAGACEGTETLLLIEDEDVLREVIRDALCDRGYWIFTACNGREAIALCSGEAKCVDAIVTDLGMPEMSAPDLVRALHRIVPSTPVIGMTGYVDVDVHATVLAAGVERIVRKPFAIDELLAVLRDVLDSSLRVTT